MILDFFTPSILKKIPIINKTYLVLQEYYKRHPIVFEKNLHQRRYPLAYTFFKTYVIKQYTEIDFSIFLGQLYIHRGNYEMVLSLLSTYTGWNLTYSFDGSALDLNIELDIETEDTFNIQLLQESFTNLLKDLLLIANATYLFKEIYMKIHINFSLKREQILSVQNNIRMNEFLIKLF